MSLEISSYLRLCKVDELIRPQHSFLAPTDEVYFLREYTARASFSHSGTNQLIHNLKKPTEKKDNPEWRYKTDAIRTGAHQLKTAILSTTGLGNRFPLATLVPIPPSAAKSSVKYDDRITKMLELLATGVNSDIRELIMQTRTQTPFHSTSYKRNLIELRENYVLDQNFRVPQPEEIWIFDDVLTSGCHFKAAQMLLRDEFPNTPILGFFLARTISKGT